MLVAKDLVLRAHPNATLRSLTSVYDCMGMVFAARRTTVATDVLQMILEDDEYHRLSSSDEAAMGDIVVYRDSQGVATHVGLVAQAGPIRQEGTRDIVILSQWGADGEYIHRVDDVSPYLGTPTEYWSDRK
jgi:cell wall-associated NlpC family hydrolase